MSVLVVGSVALDAVETPHGRADGVVGGSAVFFSAAASLLTDVRVVGVVGDDYPMARLRFLAERGVDLAGLERRCGESFFWAGRYGPGFESRETLDTRLGVFADFDPAVPAAFARSEVVFLGNIDPALQLGVLDQVRSPRMAAADTMNYWIERSRPDLARLLARIDALFVNDEEARQLAGTDDLGRAAAAIRAMGPALVVVKRGALGATIFADGWSFSTPACPASRVVDPTGAGDAFAGGFLGHLDRVGQWRDGGGDRARDELRRALRFGAATGSCAVEDFSVDRFRTAAPGEIAERARLLEEAA